MNFVLKTRNFVLKTRNYAFKNYEFCRHRIETIEFPAESGTVLTTGSDIVKVGTLMSGDLVAGFGSAEVMDLVAKGATSFLGNVTLGDHTSDLLAIEAAVTSPTVLFDEDANGIGLSVSFPDPSLGTAKDPDGVVRNRTILESCVATDAFACSTVLGGTEASCLEGGACVYTAEVVEILDACVAPDVDECAGANMTMAEHNGTVAQANCQGGNVTFDDVFTFTPSRNCTFVPFNNETKAVATCSSWSQPFCRIVERNRVIGAQVMAWEMADHCGREGAIVISGAVCSSQHSDAYR